jgi:hypothetical protein
MEMKLNYTISIDLGDDHTAYDRLTIGDEIGKSIKKVIKDRKNIKLLSIQGSIDQDGELKGLEEKAPPVDVMELLRKR